jgi:hypothetical protein
MEGRERKVQEENEIQNSATVTIQKHILLSWCIRLLTRAVLMMGFSTRLCYTLGRSEHSVNVFLAKVSFHNANITVTKSHFRVSLTLISYV